MLFLAHWSGPPEPRWASVQWLLLFAHCPSVTASHQALLAPVRLQVPAGHGSLSQQWALPAGRHADDLTSAGSKIPSIDGLVQPRGLRPTAAHGFVLKSMVVGPPLVVSS